MTFYPQRSILLGYLIGANFNSTSDQAIVLSTSVTKWVLDSVLVLNASTSLTTAVGGIYNAGAKPGGGKLVDSTQVYSTLTGATKLLRITPTTLLNDTQTATTIYLSLTTAQGGAATADIYLYGTLIAP